MQFYKKHLAFRAHYSVCGLEFTTVSIVFKVLKGEKLACVAKEMSQTYTRRAPLRVRRGLAVQPILALI